MGDLDFSHCNIAMATHETTGRIIVWDRDTDTFGSAYDYPAALADLAENYGDGYRGRDLPEATLGDDAVSLHDLANAWGRKSSSGAYGDAARGAYCDCAEKLRAVLDEGELAERP